MTSVCICWLKLWELNTEARIELYKNTKPDAWIKKKTPAQKHKTINHI